MKRVNYVIFLLFIILSCEKNDPLFSGITEMDDMGQLCGNIDKTDWKFDDIWNEKEEQLFNSSHFQSTEKVSFLKNVLPIDYIPTSSAYPNPANTILNLRFDSDADTIKFVLVNDDYDRIISHKSIGGTCAFSINLSDMSKNQILRVYYKLEYTDDLAKRGHGDIKIIK